MIRFNQSSCKIAGLSGAPNISNHLEKHLSWVSFCDLFLLWGVFVRGWVWSSPVTCCQFCSLNQLTLFFPCFFRTTVHHASVPFCHALTLLTQYSIQAFAKMLNVGSLSVSVDTWKFHSIFCNFWSEVEATKISEKHPASLRRLFEQLCHGTRRYFPVALRDCKAKSVPCHFLGRVLEFWESRFYQDQIAWFLQGLKVQASRIRQEQIFFLLLFTADVM